MFAIRYKLDDGLVEEIEEYEDVWEFENIFEGTEYKFVENLPKYNAHRQFLRVVDDEIIIENKELSEEQLREIEKTEKREELISLRNWFNYRYAMLEQKYRRLIALYKLTDENTDPNDELIWLYNEAEAKRKRIQELEKQIKL